MKIFYYQSSYRIKMSSVKILYKKLRGFYRDLNKLEKIFFNIFIIDISGYSILFLSFLISTKKFRYNILNVTLIFFPLISGIITVIILQFCTVYSKNFEVFY